MIRTPRCRPVSRRSVSGRTRHRDVRIPSPRRGRIGFSSTRTHPLRSIGLRSFSWTSWSLKAGPRLKGRKSTCSSRYTRGRTRPTSVRITLSGCRHSRLPSGAGSTTDSSGMTANMRCGQPRISPGTGCSSTRPCGGLSWLLTPPCRRRIHRMKPA